MKKKIYNNKLLLLFVLLFGASLRPQVAQAAQSDSYVKKQITNHYRNSTNYYEFDGYIHYQSYKGVSNRATHYENGDGKWTDSKPRRYPSLYNPQQIVGKRLLSNNGADWGFSTVNAVWAGSKHSRPNGTNENRNVRYERYVKTTHRRDKTTPTAEGIFNPSSHVYVRGNNWWVKPNTQFQLTVQGWQNYNGFTKRLMLDDYVSSNYLQLLGEGQDLRSQMYRNGGINTFRTSGHFSVSKNDSRLNGTDRRLVSRYNITAKYSGKKYDIRTYAASKNGKTHGYIDTGIDLRTDGTAPTISFSPNGTGWRNYNTSVKISASDTGGSGVKRIRHRLYSNGSWGSWSAWTNGSSKNVTISAAGAQKLQVEAEDNVGNKRTTTSNNYYIDKILPNGTISGNPTSWTNQATLVFNATDSGGSGVRRVRQSGGSWVNGSTTSRTVSDNGTYRFEVEDNAGNTRTVSASVNRVGMLPPNASSTQSPTSWTNGNVNITWTASSSVTGGPLRRIRTHNGSSWGAWSTVSGTTASRVQTVTSNGTYRFQVEDQVGSVRDISHTVTNIDKISPNGTITGNPTSWTNQNVTLRLNATDSGGSGVRRVRTLGGSWVYGSTTTQTATTNGTYYFEVEDNAGNKRTVSATVNRIDKILPNGTISGNPIYGALQATLVFNATDSGGSGVRRVRQSGGSWVYGSTTSRTVSENGTYYFEVEDNAGNKRAVPVIVTRVGMLPPNASSTQSPTSWTNGNVNITWTASSSVTGGPLRRIRTHNGSSWGAWSTVSGTTASRVQTVTSNGTYQFLVEDQVGSVRHISHTVTNIDKTLPNGTITGNPTSWTNQNVTLRLNATDSGSGVRRVRIAGGTWVNGSTTSRTVTGNGTYSFEVEDNAGNTRTVSETVTRIDTDRPAIALSHTPETWTNGNVTTTIRVSDFGRAPNYSGLRRLRMRPQGGAWSSWSNYGTETERSSAWFEKTRTITSNGTYEVQVEDRAGNTSSRTFTISNIDKILPNGTITGNPTRWQNTDATLTFNATDSGGSGVRRVRVAGGTWVDGSTTTQTATANGIYSFEVEDNAGNTRTVSATVNRIDKSAPNGTITGNPTSWTNKDVTLTFNATDSGGSGVRRVRQSGGRWVDGSTTTQTATTNGTYSFEVEDNAGNTRTVSVTVNRIDKSAPDGTITGNPTSWTNKDVTLTFNATDTGGSGVRRVRQSGGTWVNGSTTSRTVTVNGTYSFEVEDNAGNTRTISETVTRIDTDYPVMAFSHNPITWTNGDVTTTIRARDFGRAHNVAGVRRVRMRPQGGSWDSWSNYGTETELSSAWFEKTRTITSNGTYEVQVEDRAGNVTSQTFTVDWIDKILPNGTITGNPTSWTNKDVTLTFNATDSGGSGVRRVRQSGGRWVDGSTTTQTATTNGTYSFEVEDNAGNTRTVSVTVNRIDKELPDGTITGNSTSWTNKDVTLTFNATDTGGSGVRRVRIAGGTWVNGSTTSRTVTENGTYSFEVEDNAGNKRTVSVAVNRIDKTLPNASSRQSPTGWTNGNVSITWSATASGGSPLQRVRTHDGSTWGDWTTVRGTTSSTVQTVTSNGTYQFQVEDAAGNVRDISHTVNNIDKGSPDIRSSQTPTDWTTGNVTLTIEARDFGELDNQSTHISGIASIQVKRPNGITWSDTYGTTSEHSTAYYNRTFTATESGTYVVTVTDRAGNTTTHNHTVTNIDRIPPATSGSFTPDGWTNQTITITWLADRNGDPGSPLEAYRYDRGNGDWTGWQNAPHADAFTVTQDVTENGTYQFEARDKAGNVGRSSVTVSQHDIVLPVGQITARFDRSERDDHVDYTSDELVDMIDSNRVTVDVTGVEDLGISGVDFVTIEEQRRIGYDGEWMTVGTTDYDWPDPYDTTSQTYEIDVAYAQDTRFILTVTDRAGNESSRVASNVVRQSVLQFIDFRITDVVNPQLSEEKLAEMLESDLSEGVVELTAGTNVTFDVTYQLRHLDTVDDLSGKITIKTISDDRTDTDTIQVKEDETGHNQHVTFTETFTVPQGAPKGSEITIVGNLEAKLANGTTHEISYPSNADMGVGVIDNHIEEFFRFRIVR